MSSTIPRSTSGFPLKEREGEALIVWTTTPWTLPANVAAAVKPDAEYGLREGGWRLEEGRRVRARWSGARSSSGSNTTAPSTTWRRRKESPHRVIPWEDVSLTEGTGIVHIAPGAGTEDFELSRVHDLPVLAPIDEEGRMVAELRAVRGPLDRRGRGAGDRVAA